MADIVLTAEAILTMDPDNRIVTNGGVLVRDDRIVDVGPVSELLHQTSNCQREDFGRAVLMPGLINTHCHSGFLRGTAEQLALRVWINQYINPMHRVLRPEEAEIASWLCYGESLLAGTTTVVDMWRFMEGSARAAQELGLRVLLVPYVGGAEGLDYFETLETNEELIRTWNGKANGRVNVWVGLEQQFYVTPEICRRASEMAKHYGVGLNTHSNESKQEISEAMRRHNLSPVRALEKMGVLDPTPVLLAHCVWLDDDEITLLAERGIGIAHNPVSNMKLANGIAPVTALKKAGIAVGIGTDGEKENNNLDIFEEMKVASLVGKLHEMDGAAVNSWEVLRSATIEGARAIGLEDQIGSLEAGKKADIIAVGGDTAHLTPFFCDGPFFNLHHNLVHAVHGEDVVMTMVDGRICTRDRVLRTGDMPAYIAAAERACRDLIERRTAYIESVPEYVTKSTEWSPSASG